MYLKLLTRKKCAKVVPILLCSPYMFIPTRFFDSNQLLEMQMKHVSVIIV